jgi:hypothetical protein
LPNFYPFTEFDSALNAQRLQPWLGIPIFGSNFWDPRWKQNSGSVSDSKDSGRKNFNQIPLLKNQEIGILIPKFGISKKINEGIQYFSFRE